MSEELKNEPTVVNEWEPFEAIVSPDGDDNDNDGPKSLIESVDELDPELADIVLSFDRLSKDPHCNSCHIFNGSDSGEMIDFRKLINGIPRLYVRNNEDEDDGITLDIPIKDPDDESKNLRLSVENNFAYGYTVKLTDENENTANCRVALNCDEMRDYIMKELFKQEDSSLYGDLFSVLGTIHRKPDNTEYGFLLDNETKGKILSAIITVKNMKFEDKCYAYYDAEEIILRIIYGNDFVDSLPKNSFMTYQSPVLRMDDNGMYEIIGWIIYDYHVEFKDAPID